jgi:site-specific recombinase XerD
LTEKKQSSQLRQQAGHAVSLLGHNDVRTTMIYTHTIKSTTIKEKKSPLDF